MSPLLTRSPLSERLRARLASLIESFVGGLAGLRSWRRLRHFALYTVLIWSLDGVMAVVLGKAFGMDLIWTEGVLLVAILGLASALPSAPGYIGVWQFAAVTVLVPLDFSQAQALVYVTALQMCNYLILLIFGGWAVVELNLSLGHLYSLVCWFWCVTINSLRWIGVRQTDAALVVVDRKKARVAAPPTG